MKDFIEYLQSGKRGHLVGVGGVSMEPLAEALNGMGILVTGSDMAESERTSHLRELGVKVYIGHDASNISDDTEFVVRTAAAHDDNPEIIYAREKATHFFLQAGRKKHII